jgi:sigma-E factor negative regulatory protein RseA
MPQFRTEPPAMTDEATRRAIGEPANPGEHLSALLDGELPPEQTDFLLKRVQRDAELRGTLQRYQLVGDTLRGERVQARPDFMLRVSAAIAAEPPLPAPEVRRTSGRGAAARRWLKPVAGLAVAATVASVAVVVMQRDPSGTAAPALVAATTTTTATSATPPPAPLSPAPAPLLAASSLTGEPASYITPPASRGVGVIPPAQLASYVVAHSEYSSPLGRRNVLTGLVADEVQPPAPAPAAPPRQSDAPVPPSR